MGSELHREDIPPLFIAQGRFTQNAIKGMLAKPEDRAEMVRQLFAKSGGKLLAYYMTFGEYDFLTVSEGPYEGVQYRSSPPPAVA